MKHIVFYDGECGICDRVVQWIIKVDDQERFLFAPLQGETASIRLKPLPQAIINADTLILIENFDTPDEEILIYGKATFRILWLLGGVLKIPGLISFLPSFLYDWGYRLFAKNRHRFLTKQACPTLDPSFKKRFLP